MSNLQKPKMLTLLLIYHRDHGDVNFDQYILQTCLPQAHSGVFLAIATHFKTMSHGQLVYKSLAVQCVNCSAIVTQYRTANSVTDKSMPLYVHI